MDKEFGEGVRTGEHAMRSSLTSDNSVLLRNFLFSLFPCTTAKYASNIIYIYIRFRSFRDYVAEETRIRSRRVSSNSEC